MVNSGSSVAHSGSVKFGEWLMIQKGWGCYRDIDQGERDLPDLSGLIIQKLDCVHPFPS